LEVDHSVAQMSSSPLNALAPSWVTNERAALTHHDIDWIGFLRSAAREDDAFCRVQYQTFLAGQE